MDCWRVLLIATCTIAIQTLANRHVTAYLPEYQIKCIQIQEGPECDPMFVEFRLQE